MIGWASGVELHMKDGRFCVNVRTFGYTRYTMVCKQIRTKKQSELAKQAVLSTFCTSRL